MIFSKKEASAQFTLDKFYDTFMVFICHFGALQLDIFIIFKRVARIFFKNTYFGFYVSEKFILVWNNVRVSEL